MNMEEKSGKDRITSSLADAGEDAIVKWGNNFISKNVPIALDWTVERIKEAISALVNGSNTKIRDSIRDTIYKSIEIGENNKERALILAMRKEGISESRIEEILKTSNQFLVTKEQTIQK